MSYHYFEIYPKTETGEDKALYFIEFLQFFKDNPITWKLYKRSYIFSKEEYKKMVSEKPDDLATQLMGNEGHPWWLLDGTLQPNGTVPDKKWLLWMVDALNEKVQKELTTPTT